MKQITLEYTSEIAAAGLSREQAVVYETLLKLGTVPASHLTKGIPVSSALSRPLVYKVLEELVGLDLAEKHDIEGKVATFTAKHPLALKDVLAKRQASIEEAAEKLGGAVGKLISTFNLLSGKPGVQFFEGMNGMRAVLQDALSSTTPIYAFLDIAQVSQELPNVSREFGEERVRRKIVKRNLSLDTPENRKLVDVGYHDEFTEERLIPWNLAPVGASMQIYENKISYLTFGTQKIGVIITDPHITQMHRGLFEALWNSPQAYIPKKESA
jgi:HTH-type transcriptional regulator, sugar sensing transcriptional regulator